MIEDGIFRVESNGRRYSTNKYSIRVIGKDGNLLFNSQRVWRWLRVQFRKESQVTIVEKVEKGERWPNMFVNYCPLTKMYSRGRSRERGGGESFQKWTSSISPPAFLARDAARMMNRSGWQEPFLHFWENWEVGESN